jgi:hypothetical protein
MRVGRIFGAMSALLALATPGAAGVTLPLNPVLISKGHVGHRHWYVIAGPQFHRPGICLEIGAYNRQLKEGGNFIGTCSAPAVKRGIVLTAHGPADPTGQPTFTAVGAAFNMAVKRVEVTLFDGSIEKLKLLRIPSGRTGGSRVSAYRYAALAVRGPWCAKELVTYGPSGQPLWKVEAGVLAGIDYHDVPDLERTCSSRTAFAPHTGANAVLDGREQPGPARGGG